MPPGPVAPDTAADAVVAHLAPEPTALEPTAPESEPAPPSPRGGDASGDDEALVPAGWTRYSTDDGEGNHYFVHGETGETVWVLPDDAQGLAVAADAAAATGGAGATGGAMAAGGAASPPPAESARPVEDSAPSLAPSLGPGLVGRSLASVAVPLLDEAARAIRAMGASLAKVERNRAMLARALAEVEQVHAGHLEVRAGAA